MGECKYLAEIILFFFLQLLPHTRAQNETSPSSWPKYNIKIKMIYHFVYVFVNEAEAVLMKGCVSQTTKAELAVVMDPPLYFRINEIYMVLCHIERGKLLKNVCTSV